MRLFDIVKGHISQHGRANIKHHAGSFTCVTDTFVHLFNLLLCHCHVIVVCCCTCKRTFYVMVRSLTHLKTDSYQLSQNNAIMSYIMLTARALKRELLAAASCDNKVTLTKHQGHEMFTVMGYRPYFTDITRHPGSK